MSRFIPSEDSLQVVVPWMVERFSSGCGSMDGGKLKNVPGTAKILIC